MKTEKEGFVTSRSFPLPTDAGEMANKLWFNMWQKKHWPYRELEEGNTLYWFDTKKQSVIWHSRVHKVERFEYANKDEARKRFLAAFGLFDLNDQYFDNAKDHGFCIAYKVDSIVPVNVPKPSDYKFPMIGWLRCSDSSHDWLKNLQASSSPDEPPDKSVAEAEKSYAKSQGFMLDSKLRKALENYAMVAATEYFSSKGFAVDNHSANHPYDLRCTKKNEVLYVEVKGTQTNGKGIFLTFGEVEFASGLLHLVSVMNRLDLRQHLALLHPVILIDQETDNAA
jgi:hypothetical protein